MTVQGPLGLSFDGSLDLALLTMKFLLIPQEGQKLFFSYKKSTCSECNTSPENHHQSPEKKPCISEEEEEDDDDDEEEEEEEEEEPNL